jgi:hypothetical protein
LKRRTGALVVLALAGALRGGETAARRVVAALVPPPPGGPAVALLAPVGPDGRLAGPATLAAFEGGALPIKPGGVFDAARPAWSASLGGAARTRPALVASPNNLIFFLNGTRGYPSFARRMQDRRRVLVAGGADGSLHGFDAGFAGEKSTGSGIFTFVPGGARTSASPGLEPPPSFDDVYVDATWAGGGGPCPEELGAGGRHCQWRTVLAGGLGASGRSVWALDVTAPDSKRPGSAAELPDCVARGGTPAAGCTGAYPTKLWQLSDPGLGFTFSTPRFGRVRVRNAATGRPEERPIAVFGGGWDPADVTKVAGRSVHASRSGNALFVVDVATGAVLYRTDRGYTRSASGAEVSRPFGSIPSAVAALDLDEDGFTDTVWFGDVNGRLWKLTLPADDARLALLTPGGVRGTGSGSAWRCVLVFDANSDAAGRTACAATSPGGALAGCPEENAFTRPPAVVKMGVEPATGEPVYGIALATGNVLDPSFRSDRGGRVVFLLDPPAPAGAAARLRTLADLDRLRVPDVPGGDCVPGGAGKTNGWTLELPAGERADSDLLAIAHELHFTARSGVAGGPARYRLYRLRTENGVPCRGRPLDVTFASAPVAWTDARGHVRVTVAGEAGGEIRLVEEPVPVQASPVGRGP